jgi:4a-hydroxytetrahydrobiopterin dehydratase
MKKLSEDQIQINLARLSDWSVDNNAITKSFKFKDFIEALSFVNAVGFEAEKMDHHPDILIYGWNNVKIILSTHSAQGITENDFNLAKKIEERRK